MATTIRSTSESGVVSRGRRTGYERAQHTRLLTTHCRRSMTSLGTSTHQPGPGESPRTPSGRVPGTPHGVRHVRVLLEFYNGVVKRIGVRELNQQTSRVIDRVAHGEVLEITDRGRPVARLVPVIALPEPLDRLVAEGRAVPASLWGPIPMPSVDATDGVDVAAELASMRDEER